MATDLAAVVQQIKSYQQFTRLLTVPRLGTGELIPFVPNNVQRRIVNEIILKEREGRPARLIVLKSRQVGVSTLIQSILLHRAITRRGFKGLTVAHEGKPASELFRIGEGFYGRLDKALTSHPSLARTSFNRGKELELGNSSRLIVETANDAQAGRGTSGQAIHMSEVAFWNEGQDAALSIRQTVQDIVGTLVVMESTPNGAGGFFYDEWNRAKDGETDYIPLFYPWFEFETNVVAADERHFDGQGNFKYADRDEESMAERYSLSPERILWRRRKLATECGGDIDKFNQEYPSNDTDCFLTSGRLYFGGVLINSWAPREPLFVGDFPMPKKDRDKLQDSSGPFRLFEDPKPFHRYAAFIDIAGVQGDHEIDAFTGERKGDAEDYSVIWVMDCSTQRTVAVWRDRVDADVLAQTAVAIGLFYNKALLCPEINGEGMAVLVHLNNLRYRKIYRRSVVDTRGEPETEKQGWRTTSANRPGLLAGLKIRLRDDADTLCDERLKREMQTFVIANGKPQAKPGSHDDLVIAAAGAIWIAEENAQHLHLDPETGEPKKRPKPKFKPPSYYL